MSAVKTTEVSVMDSRGNTIDGSVALVWSTNAAWLCTNCKHLIADETPALRKESRVACPTCPAVYEVLQHPNRNGQLNNGPARGVRLLD